MNKKQIKWRNRIIVALVIFFIVFAATEFLPLGAWLGSETNAVYLEFALFLIPYLIAGYDVCRQSRQEHRPRPGFRREPPYDHRDRRRVCHGVFP